MLIHVANSYYMLCSVVICYQELLHIVQCCCMLSRVIISCTVFLDVTNSYYMMCSVVTCYQELLHAVQCCYMLPRVITYFPVLLHVI